jgi:hypothetical protein
MKNLPKMNTRTLALKISGVLFILMGTTGMISITAQPGLTAFADAGKSNISDDMFLKSSFLGNYRWGKNHLEAGFQTNLMNRKNIVFSGFNINGSRDFKIKNTVLELNGFWLWTAYSQYIKEINYGFSLSMIQKHFEVMIGTNFRDHGIRKKVIDGIPIEDGAAKVHENFNLMYSLSYNVRTDESKWNTGVTVTNIDYFLIDQETNPCLNIHGSFRVSSPVRLFTEVWYKNAGMLNMSPNYFGFVIRGGVKWNF